MKDWGGELLGVRRRQEGDETKSNGRSRQTERRGGEVERWRGEGFKGGLWPECLARQCDQAGGGGEEGKEMGEAIGVVG